MENLIGKKVIIVNNSTCGFENGTICEVIKSIYETPPFYYRLEGLYDGEILELKHKLSDFEVVE